MSWLHKSWPLFRGGHPSHLLVVEWLVCIGGAKISVQMGQDYKIKLKKYWLKIVKDISSKINK
jgi:hypothetical protein